jgi:hypothetical protein
MVGNQKFQLAYRTPRSMVQIHFLNGEEPMRFIAGELSEELFNRSRQ